jgi:hypothetical protein
MNAMNFLSQALKPLVVAERAQPRPQTEGLILITRCTQVGPKGQWAYEAIEFWKDGIARPFLVRASWLSGMGLSREVHSPFGHFDGGEYRPVDGETFGKLLADWIPASRVTDATKLVEAFRAVVAETHYSLGLANEVDYARPMGL